MSFSFVGGVLYIGLGVMGFYQAGGWLADRQETVILL